MSDQTFIVSVLVAYQLGVLNGIAVGLAISSKIDRWMAKRDKA
ncbi:hypothetical protein [Nocardioides sp.]